MNVSDAIRVIVDTLGDPVPTVGEQLTILNDAARWFLGTHDWKFLEREAYLNVRAQVSATGGTWNSATLTLTFAAGALSSYSFLAGDKVEITGGTGINTGFVEIDSATSNTLVLRASIGTTAPTDVAVTLHSWGVALPTDFGQMVPGFPGIAPGFAQSFEMVDMAEIEQYRALFTGGSTAAYLGAVSWGIPTGGGPRIPRLEIAPEIVQGRLGAFVIVYRSKWVTISDVTAGFYMPEFAEPAFRECLRHFARGSTEEDVATIDARLMGFVGGPLMEGAIFADSQEHVDYGRIKGGAVKAAALRGPFQNFEILDPS